VQEQNLRSQVDHLHAELEETESAMQRDRAVKKALEKVFLTPHSPLGCGGQLILTQEIKTLCNDLNQRTREKEEALARLESQRLVRVCGIISLWWNNVWHVRTTSMFAGFSVAS